MIPSVQRIVLSMISKRFYLNMQYMEQEQIQEVRSEGVMYSLHLLKMLDWYPLTNPTTIGLQSKTMLFEPACLIRFLLNAVHRSLVTQIRTSYRFPFSGFPLEMQRRYSISVLGADSHRGQRPVIAFASRMPRPKKAIKKME